MRAPSAKKPPYPIDDAMRAYLRAYGREHELPIEYDALMHYHEVMPLLDSQGQDTLWLTVSYAHWEREEIYSGLRHMYAMLKSHGDLSIMEHLIVDRIDFCEFGNSQPFRVRIVNRINDIHDYFYVKKADASRIYGLELEHLLSPNRMHFLVHNKTLVEEHVLGIPGDIFMAKDMLSPTAVPSVRLAKEFVKFNERCFVRLLGDMRSYNYVVDITPDFEEAHYRIRPMDFDQQSYDGRPSFYRPQYFVENNPLIQFGIKHMDVRSMNQYQREERAVISMRMKSEEYRLGQLINAMRHQPLAPMRKIVELREGLAELYRDKRFLERQTMGGLVQESLNLLEHDVTNLPIGAQPA